MSQQDPTIFYIKVITYLLPYISIILVFLSSASISYINQIQDGFRRHGTMKANKKDWRRTVIIITNYIYIILLTIVSLFLFYLLITINVYLGELLICGIIIILGLSAFLLKCCIDSIKFFGFTLKHGEITDNKKPNDIIVVPFITMLTVSVIFLFVFYLQGNEEYLDKKRERQLHAKNAARDKKRQDDKKASSAYLQQIYKQDAQTM